MLFDVLVAAIITVVAIALGLTVHPLLFFVIALAVIYLLARHSGRGARAGRI